MLQRNEYYNFINIPNDCLSTDKTCWQEVCTLIVVFVIKNVLTDNIFYFKKDKSKAPKASIVINNQMKNKLQEL